MSTLIKNGRDSYRVKTIGYLLSLAILAAFCLYSSDVLAKSTIITCPKLEVGKTYAIGERITLPWPLNFWTVYAPITVTKDFAWQGIEINIEKDSDETQYQLYCKIIPVQTHDWGVGQSVYYDKEHPGQCIIDHRTEFTFFCESETYNP